MITFGIISDVITCVVAWWGNYSEMKYFEGIKGRETMGEYSSM